MALSLSNFTDDHLTCHVVQLDEQVSLSAGKTTLVVAKSRKLIIKDASQKREVKFKVPFSVDKKVLRKIHRPGWPWMIYVYAVPASALSSTGSKGEVNVSVAGSNLKKQKMVQRAVVLPVRDTKNWLSVLDDKKPLSDLCLPGTHETMALYGWPVSQCQSMTLTEQLEAGIRVLDIRLSIDKLASVLRAYHGIQSERVDWPTILSDLYKYLQANKRETLVVSLKQEDVGQEDWNKLLVEGIEKSQGGWGMWFIDGRVPKLGEVRGKCVMFSRFGPRGYPGEKGWGIHPTTWPNSLKGMFEWNCGDTIVRTQDWYNVPSFLSIPDKTELSISILLPDPPEKKPALPVLRITFTSAASLPLAFPGVIAKGMGWPSLGLGFEGVNARFAKWLTGVLDPSNNVAGTAPNAAIAAAAVGITSAMSEGSSSSGSSASSAGGARKEAAKEEETTTKTPTTPTTATATASAAPAEPMKGWILMDFPDELVIPLLIECNFRTA